MTATDRTLDLAEKEQPEWLDCDLLVFTVFTRTSKAVCTELADYKRLEPMMSTFDHGGTDWTASDARQVR